MVLETPEIPGALADLLLEERHLGLEILDLGFLARNLVVPHNRQLEDADGGLGLGQERVFLVLAVALLHERVRHDAAQELRVPARPARHTLGYDRVLDEESGRTLLAVRRLAGGAGHRFPGAPVQPLAADGAIRRVVHIAARG